MTGDQLKRIRRKLRLTQAELAAKLGVAANTLARWERDELPIRDAMENLIKLVAKEKHRNVN